MNSQASRTYFPVLESLLLLRNFEDLGKKLLLAGIRGTFRKEARECLVSALLKLLDVQAQLLYINMLLSQGLCHKTKDVVEKVHPLWILVS